MLNKLFGFDPTKTTIRTEIVAGITTFLTMSYILAVNPSMFGLLEGMPAGSVFTSTALAAIIGCLAMAFIGKLPFGLAPGMGLNAWEWATHGNLPLQQYLLRVLYSLYSPLPTYVKQL